MNKIIKKFLLRNQDKIIFSICSSSLMYITKKIENNFNKISEIKDKHDEILEQYYKIDEKIEEIKHYIQK